MRASDTLFGREVHEGSAEELPSLLKTRFPMGYYLILTDEESASALGKVLKRLLKKIFVVLREEDVLPLFSAPDAVTCVVGAGKAIAAARYFACVRSLPLVAVCFSCRPQGLGGRTASVNVCGENVSYPVPPPDLIFAADLRKGEREEAEAFLSACALSALSFDLCFRLGLPDGKEAGKPLFSLLDAASREISDPPGRGSAELFRAVLACEYCFSGGFPDGEIFVFVRLSEKFAGFSRPRALRECTAALSGLYALFFDGGFYRGGMVDYNARREEAKRLFPGAAGTERTAFPTAEQLAARKAAFEREKGEAAARLSAFRAALPAREGRNAEETQTALLRLLPELSGGGGIAALMRDFGLL